MDTRVMSIFAHQDDETFSAGGVLASYGNNAYAVSVTADPNRETEFQKAGKILGINAMHLDFETIEPQNKTKIKTKLMEIIREIKPTHVITHVNFDYHHEHRLLREIVEEAVEWVSHTTNPKFEAHQVLHLWAAETTVMIPVPEIYVDITDFNETRMKAIKVYDSQSHKGGKGFYSKFHGTRTKLRGIQAGVDHAEAFISIPLLRVGAFKPKKVLKSLDDLSIF